MNSITCLCPNCGETLVEKPSSSRFECSVCDSDFHIDEYGIVHLAQSDFYYREMPREILQNILRGTSKSELLDRFEQAISDLRLDGARSYALDSTRAGGTFFLDLDDESVVLDYGAGWGTITQVLADICGHVVSLDLTCESLEFSARIAEKKNVTYIHAGDKPQIPFADGQFDAVILNGVLEWVPENAYLNENPRDVQLAFLAQVRRVLRPGGQIYIGIENRLGYRYFTGMREDHTGLRFGALLPRCIADLYSKKMRGSPYRTYTYSEPGYHKLLKEEGFSAEVYYPWVNYRRFSELFTRRNVNKYHSRQHAYRSFGNRMHESLLDSLSRLNVLHWFFPSFSLICKQVAAENTTNMSFVGRVLAEHGESFNDIASIRLSSTQSLLVQTEQSLFKIPLSENARERLKATEWARRKLMYDYPSLVQFAAIEHGQLHELDHFIYTTDAWLAHSDSHHKNVSTWLDEFFETVSRYSVKKELDLPKRFSDVLYFVRHHPTLSKKVQQLISNLGQNEWVVGPIHGDLHAGNIISVASDKHFLIDWDRFEEEGPLIVDRIHYRVQNAVKRKRFSWLDAINFVVNEDKIQDEANLDSIKLYILDKVQKDLSGFPHPAYLSIEWHQQAQQALLWSTKE